MQGGHFRVRFHCISGYPRLEYWYGCSVDSSYVVSAMVCLSRAIRFLCANTLTFAAALFAAAESPTPLSPEAIQFFESKVRPLLIQRCYECHSHEATIKGGLALDSREGWSVGGDGGPAIVPGDPEGSRLINAISYDNPDLRMPPKEKLNEAEIAVLFEWVKLGAPDPREKAPSVSAAEEKKSWDEVYRERLGWWSLQPVGTPAPPPVTLASWPRNEIDHFILAKLEAAKLSPAPEADRRVLARRLSFALTGWPPKPEAVERFVNDTSPNAYALHVESLLSSPHFGERWARHWMDVVHYADTHGYEWDTPAKNAWMYRDYLVNAFNDDISFRQLILEQLAGDLVEPRIDPKTGLVASLIGPTAMRLGERRHGDNADAEGVTQEAIANIIDTVSKGFLATTVACAQCHDHKLDAVAQRDYFGLAGIFMSTRWISRSADAADPNMHVIDELRRIKGDIREHVASVWRDSADAVTAAIKSTPLPPPAGPTGTTPDANKAAEGFPDSLHKIWLHVNQAAKKEGSFTSSWSSLAQQFRDEQEKRVAANAANLSVVADFSEEALPAGWQVDGFGMKHGLATDGDIVIADEGDAAIAHLVTAGRWSHLWSTRLSGAVRSPLFDQEAGISYSMEFAAGKHAAQSLIVDNAFHSERMRFLDRATPGQLTFTAGSFPALAGEADTKPRRVYLELVTKSLNNYFPPRHAYGGLKDADERDPRSWLGITRLVRHASEHPPQDDLARFALLFSDPAIPATAEDLAKLLASFVLASVEHWHAGSCSSEDVRIINDALLAKWLPNEPLSDPELAQLVARYRETEAKIQPERVVGSTSDWNEGRNERIGVRGSYTDLGEEVPRGNISFLGGPVTPANPNASGRLEFAQSIADPNNPLTARVFVNRVWSHLFGTGIVRTVDDFGHLGELPSHPELLDWLAQRFVNDGWSLKKLVALMVTSATWRQSSIADSAAVTVDPENRLWHHHPMRRLDAESIRDAMLAVSGRMDATLGGPPIDPHRAAEDPAKRLVCGPVDGEGRRSVYLKMTLMEPPKFLALFNQPIPKLTTGKRDTTNVPDQALAMLNDPFVVAMARHWSEQILLDAASTTEQRISGMFQNAFGRAPSADETARLVALANRCAELRGVDTDALAGCQPVWQDVAHALFNLKEFINVQ